MNPQPPRGTTENVAGSSCLLPTSASPQSAPPSTSPATSPATSRSAATTKPIELDRKVVEREAPADPDPDDPASP